MDRSVFVQADYPSSGLSSLTAKGISSCVVKKLRGRDDFEPTKEFYMNKVLLGVFLGAVLGAFDGLTALFTPDPAILAAIVEIIVRSTRKGLAADLICC